MTWDVLILHPEPASAEERPQLKPLGMADDIRRAVSRTLSGIEWVGPAQGRYEGRSFDIEVVLPSRGVVDSFALHVRGVDDPTPLIARLCKRNGWAAFDSASGSFLDLDDPTPERWERGTLQRAQVYALAQIHRRPEAGRAAPPKRLGRRRLLWLVPLLLTLHNVEEALFMEGFLARLASALPAFLSGVLPTITYGQFLAALGVVTAVPWLFAASGPLERRSRAFLLVLGTQMVVLLNVVSHAAAAVWLRFYVPGLATALLVNLPFSVYLFRRALAGSWVRPRDLAWLFLAALLVHGPGLIGLMVLAGWAVG